MSVNGSSILSNQELSQNSFMQLMVQQMKYQDPLNPMSNTQFLSQLAQFTALQQMTAVAQSTSSTQTEVQNLVTDISMLLAHQLLGTTVQIKNGSQTVTGQVSGVQMGQNGPEVLINQQAYPLSDVEEMSS